MARARVVHRLGAADQVVADYLALGVEFAGGRSFEDRPGTGLTALGDSLRRSGLAATVLPQDGWFCVGVRYLVGEPIPRLDLAVYVLTPRGVPVLDEVWSDTVAIRPNAPGEHEVTATIPPVLNVGDYTIGVWIGTTYETIVDESPAARVRLEGSVKERPDRLVELGIPWSQRRLDGADQAHVHRG